MILEIPTDELVEQTRDALRHLDDPLYLESLPLGRAIAQATDRADVSRGELMCSVFRLAITSMEPTSLGEGSVVDRSTYQVLYRYAIMRKGMTMIVQELGMSLRSGYYALSRATEALACVIQDLIESGPAKEAGSLAEDSSRSQHVRDELARLADGYPQEVELTGLVAEIADDMGALARESDVDLQVALGARELRVATKRALLRQVIVNVLSWLVGNCVSRGLNVRVAECGETVAIAMDCTLREEPLLEGPDAPHEMARRIADTLGLRWRESHDAGHCQVSIEIPRCSRKHVLVVDDNEGMIALIRRYLDSHLYAVWGANDGQQALNLLREADPDVIILDIMLPTQDGWEVLSMLRDACKATGRDVPIVVCSVINDPRLARVFGAKAFVHKPVTRDSLLQALEAATSSS